MVSPRRPMRAPFHRPDGMMVCFALCTALKVTFSTLHQGDDFPGQIVHSSSPWRSPSMTMGTSTSSASSAVSAGCWAAGVCSAAERQALPQQRELPRHGAAPARGGSLNRLLATTSTGFAGTAVGHPAVPRSRAPLAGVVFKPRNRLWGYSSTSRLTSSSA